jgi:hypothetical protein
MSQNAQDLGLTSHAIALYLKSLHSRIVKNQGQRVGDRLVSLTLRDRYKRYYEARERIRQGCDDSEPPLEVPAPDAF